MGSIDLQKLKGWVQQDWKAQGEWREKADEEFAFVDGHQWDEQAKAEFEGDSRIAVVFNRTAPILASVAGSEINNRTEVRFIPREIGDAKPNEVLSAGAEWFRDQANAEDEESQAFYDMLVCGIGWTETTLDFEADPEGEPSVDRIDPCEMAWDCHAHRKGLQDAQRVHRVHKLSRDAARDMFPGVDDYLLDADWLDKSDDDEGETNHNAIGDEYAADGDTVAEKPSLVRIVQTQWRERVRFVEYADPVTGERGEMTPADYAKISKFIQLPARETSRWEWRQAFIGKEVLKENQPDPEGCTFHAMTGHWDRKDKRMYGLLRSMMDPQRFANKWLSQTLHIINTNSKGGLIAETGAVEDVREFEESWAAADSISWIKKGMMGAVQEKSGPAMPASLMQLTEFAISSIRDVSGVSLELMGMREANQPGVLEYQRRQSAMTTLAAYFDAMRFYRKRQGETMLNFLRNHIAPTGRLVRITRGDQHQYIPLAMADDTRKYDVIVDDSPSAPNEKEKVWSILQAMLPVLQNAGLGWSEWADIIEYSPLPSSFAEKVRAKAEESQQENPMQQIAMAQAQAELQKTQTEAAENQANAQLDHVKAQQIAMETQLAPARAGAEIQKAFPHG